MDNKEATEDEIREGTFLAWLLGPLFPITTFIPESWEDAQWFLGIGAVLLVGFFVLTLLF
jgi:hypothetical protein